MKKHITLCAATFAFAVMAADTDVGAIVTDKNIEDVAKVENLAGANAGKATVTINDNSGTAKSVTVYNAATIDTALAGKASSDDLASVEAKAQAAANAAYANATNYTALGYLPTAADRQKRLETGYGHYINFNGDTVASTIDLYGSGTHVRYKSDGTILKTKSPSSSSSATYTYQLPDASGTFALFSDIASATNTLWTAIPSWARAASKPSYNFSEIGSTPTSLSGYGITDAKIENGTITLGANTLTPLTSYTETDPVFTAAKPTMDAAIAAKVPLANVKIGGTAITAETVVELGNYYVKTVDGKPHLFLRGN